MPEHGYPRFPTIHDDTVVFASEDDLWITPAAGGTARRLTFQAAQRVSVVGWTPDGQSVVYASSAAHPLRGENRLWEVDREGGLPRRLPYGPASAISRGLNGGIVL